MSTDGHAAETINEDRSLARRLFDSSWFRVFQIAPAVLWIGIFLTLPFLIIISYSFFESAPLTDGLLGGSLTAANYLEFFARPVYLSILWDSLVIAVVTTVVTLALVYPAAYYLAFSDLRYKNLFLLLFILPFWMNIVIRTYAWRQVFGEGGLVNYTLSFVGAGPIDVMFTRTAVIIGLVHVFLPFMLLPVYSSLSNIDRSQIESAKNLGANRIEAFTEITLPQSVPGVGAGVMLVFVLSFGAFVVPELLGGAQNSMIANLIGSMFLELQSWEVGSAIAVIFTALVLALVYAFNRVIGLEGLYGGENA